MRVAEIRRTSILAIDYGKVRIGLALADIETALPRPLTTIERVNRNEDMRRLRELTREHAVKEIVVGLPLRLDGTRGEMAEEATRFGERGRKAPAAVISGLVGRKRKTLSAQSYKGNSTVGVVERARWCRWWRKKRRSRLFAMKASPASLTARGMP